jgi:hypothetical protein
VDPNEVLARVVVHIPDPHRHVIRHYGAYSSVVRARQRREAPARAGTQQSDTPALSAATTPIDPDMRGLRRRWAELLRRIYEVDPLVCPKCGATMRIIAFVIERRVIRRVVRHLAVGTDDTPGLLLSSVA